MKPVVGVLPLWDDEKNSLWMLPGYFQGIEEAGGIPVMLPLTTDVNVIQQCVDMCDGFLFTGGQDVSPELYGEQAMENVVSNKLRDDMESVLVSMALKEDKSILGICRGIQFLNAYLGGTLYQDLPTQYASRTEHHQKPPYDVHVHKNIIIKDSPLYALVEREELLVNSYHHQAIKELSPQLKEMAKSEDGLIEAVYMPGQKFVWAVQWHPEFSYKRDESSRRILEKFVASMESENE